MHLYCSVVGSPGTHLILIPFVMLQSLKEAHSILQQRSLAAEKKADGTRMAAQIERKRAEQLIAQADAAAATAAARFQAALKAAATAQAKQDTAQSKLSLSRQRKLNVANKEDGKVQQAVLAAKSEQERADETATAAAELAKHLVQLRVTLDSSRAALVRAQARVKAVEASAAKSAGEVYLRGRTGTLLTHQLRCHLSF